MPKNVEWPDEAQLYLLEKFADTRKLIQSVEDLDTKLCDLVDSHVESWVNGNLDGEWKGTYSLEDDGNISFWLPSWAMDDDSDVKAVHIEIGIETNSSEEYWTSHMLGLAKDPMVVMIRLEKSLFIPAETGSEGTGTATGTSTGGQQLRGQLGNKQKEVLVLETI